MKFTIFSEDFRDGIKADWPAIPRIGEFVSFKFHGGTSTLRVESVKYFCGPDGELDDVEVHLTY